MLILTKNCRNFKNLQNWKKVVKKPCFLTLFRIFLNLGSILVLQTIKISLMGFFRIFWHPWHPWGRVNSGDISFLIFVFDFSAWQCHLAYFFHYSQIWKESEQISPVCILAHVHFGIKWHNIDILAQTFRHGSPVPKCPCANISLCRNVPVL